MMSVDNLIREISEYIKDFDINSDLDDFELTVECYKDYFVESKLYDRDLSVEEEEVLAKHYNKKVCNEIELQTILYLPKIFVILFTHENTYEKLKEVLNKKNIKFLTSLNITKNEGTNS